jgi:hypothetical protein
MNLSFCGSVRGPISDMIRVRPPNYSIYPYLACLEGTKKKLAKMAKMAKL